MVDEVDSGSVADWVQAGGTIVALAGLTYAVARGRSEARTLESEKRLAMARAVGVKSHVLTDEGPAGSIRVYYEVRNSSAYPVDDLVLIVDDEVSGEDQGDVNHSQHAVELVFGTVLAGDSESGHVDVPVSGPVQSFRFMNAPAYIQFVDCWAQPWERGPGVLRALDSPPRVC